MCHIVIVEDDNDMGYLLSTLINKEEWLDAIHIPNVDAAMERSVWDLPNVIGLIDLMLPKITGIDVARWVKSVMPHRIPLIAISASSKHSPIYKEAVESGLFIAMFEKPIPFPELFSLLREILDGNG